jgi:serine/threonine-protein kinase
MVTGQRAVPYNDAVQSVFEAILTRPVPPPSSIVSTLPTTLDEFVAKALAKYPAGRFSSARAMSKAALAL